MSSSTNKIKLKKYLQSVFSNKTLSLRLIKKGHNQDTYLVRVLSASGTKLYIAKIATNSEDSNRTFLNQVRMLKYLECKKFKNVPQVVFYDLKEKLSVESFVGDADLKSKNFDNKLLKKLANQLAKLHSLSAEDFKLFCRKNDLGEVLVEDEKTAHKLYCLDRFKLVKRSSLDTTLVRWINAEVDKVEIGKKRKSNHLVWGDIGNNFRLAENSFFMIDFEYSSIGYSSELAYIKIHTHFSGEQFTELVKYYSAFRNISLNRLLRDIKNEEKKIRLNDIIWAAMKWTEALQNKSDDNIVKYSKLTNIRMRMYQKL